MKEVSCKVFDLLFRDLKKRGIDAGRLVEGTGCTLDHLRNKHERIDWNTYLEIMKNADRLWSEEEYVALGGAFFGNPLIRPFTFVGWLFFTARDFYVWTATPKSGVGMQLFSCIQPSTLDLGPDKLELRLMMAQGYEPCRSFFLLSLGALRDAPKLLGLESAQIEMVEEPRGARYVITCPKGGGALRRAKNWAVRLFMAKAVAQELEDSNEELTRRYSELDRARAQLETAHAISNVIHGELDLEKTANTIATALVEKGGFVRAEVKVGARLEGGFVGVEAVSGSPQEELVRLQAPLSTRQRTLGELSLWVHEIERSDGAEILEYVLPTISMALDNAVTFRALEDYRDNLELKVEERTRDLQEAMAAVKEAQVARDRIFANVNHELRTPLSVILLAARRAGRQTGLTEETEKTLAAIGSNAERLLHLVEGLLLLAASREAQLELKRTPNDLAELIRDAATSLTPAAEEAGLELRCVVPDRVPAMVDPHAISRAVSNLISNAIKFTKEGSIDVRLVVEEGDAEISVADTGIGVDEEFRAKLFGRFEQGRHAPVRPGIRGSGIGLPIAREIAMAHGGSVEYSPNEGGGSVFRIRLGSVVQDAVEVGTPPDAPSMAPVVLHRDIQTVLEPAGAARSTILVAEDEPALLEEIGRILQKEHRVLLASDGAKALELAKEHLPDLLVTDVQMPEMDGLELARAFRTLPGNRLAPILMLTAHGALSDRLAGFDAGALDYVTKPFAAEELSARVRSQLEIRDLALKLSSSEKLASLGTLSAGLAHEFRNPANTVVNAIGPLKSMLPQELLAETEPVGELFSVLESCASQILHLSTQLLGYSKHQPLDLRTHTFSSVLAQALALVKPGMEGVSLEQDVVDRDEIRCSPPFLVQVLTNLLENAVHAAGDGGRVGVRSFKAGERLVVEISDSGSGIPPEMRERVFEPFFSTKAPGEGTGLGLHAARQIVELHGGRLSAVDSKEGAVFRLDLPLAADGGPRAPGRRPEAPASSVVSQ